MQLEDRTRPRPRLMSRGDVVFGLVVGLLLAAVLVAVIPEARTHMFGGTERRETTVADLSVGTRSGGSDREVTQYVLTWDQDGVDRTTTFRRSGPPRRDVGDTWDLWVSDDGTSVNDESPLALWLWFGLGMPAASLMIGLAWNWRQRMFTRMTLRDIERRNARRARRASQRPS